MARFFLNGLPAFKLIKALGTLQPFKSKIIKAKKLGDLEEERRQILGAESAWGRKILELFQAELTVIGKENLPEKGPVVFVSNHQGYGDIISLCAGLDKFQFAFIAKAELLKLPFYGEWMELIRCVPIERDDTRASLRAIEEGISLLNQGFSLLIFPEGTRSKGGEMKEFKKGSLRLATKPKVPVIPIAIDGTADLFENHGYVKNGGKVTISILPAIETKDMAREEASQLSKITEDLIREELKRLKGDKVTGSEV